MAAQHIMYNYHCQPHTKYRTPAAASDLLQAGMQQLLPRSSLGTICPDPASCPCLMQTCCQAKTCNFIWLSQRGICALTLCTITDDSSQGGLVTFTAGAKRETGLSRKQAMIGVGRSLSDLKQQLMSNLHEACRRLAHNLAIKSSKVMDRVSLMSAFRPCILLGGGTAPLELVRTARMHQPAQNEELPIWPASGTSLASTMQIHNALLAVERSLCINPQQQDLLVSNLFNFPLPHVALAKNMLSYGQAEQLLLDGHTYGINEPHISHQHGYLHEVFHHRKTHSVIFGDNVHWRVVCLDGRRKIAYCIDPYGDQGCLSFRPREANVVMNALKAMLHQRTGWTIQVTVHGCQSASDGHSCGMWAVWLAHKFNAIHHWSPHSRD